MKTILIMLTALPLLAIGPSDAKFSGHVIDGGNNQQMADAIVTVNAPNGYIASTVTNKAGVFSFQSLPAGEYNFRVTARGFAIYERKITIAGETGVGVKELDIRLLVPANKQTVSVAELENIDISHVGNGGIESRRGY